MIVIATHVGDAAADGTAEHGLPEVQASGGGDLRRCRLYPKGVRCSRQIAFIVRWNLVVPSAQSTRKCAAVRTSHPWLRTNPFESGINSYYTIINILLLPMFFIGT